MDGISVSEDLRLVLPYLARHVKDQVLLVGEIHSQIRKRLLAKANAKSAQDVKERSGVLSLVSTSSFDGGEIEHLRLYKTHKFLGMSTSRERKKFQVLAPHM